MDLSEFQIRPMRVDHSKGVHELCAQLGYSQTEKDVRARIAEVQNHADHFLRVAEAPNDKVLAWIHGCAEIALEADAYVRVSSLVVDARYRGRGIGKRLMADLEYWTIERGICLVSLRSQTYREEAHGFYERLGYKKTKTSFKFEKDVDRAEMTKSLAMVARSFEDIKAGRTSPAKESIEKIAAEFGLKLERRSTNE